MRPCTFGAVVVVRFGEGRTRRSLGRPDLRLDLRRDEGVIVDNRSPRDEGIHSVGEGDASGEDFRGWLKPVSLLQNSGFKRV